jgi:hypothetical protein
MALTERVTQSYLWVLGAYEMIRAIEQRCRKNRPSGITDDIADAAAETKKAFERVRVPLAKYEAARRFSATDSTVVLPAIDASHGIAWRVSVDVYISRESLAQQLLDFLRKLLPHALSGRGHR